MPYSEDIVALEKRPAMIAGMLLKGSRKRDYCHHNPDHNSFVVLQESCDSWWRLTAAQMMHPLVTVSSSYPRHHIPNS
jgi:hypothetical protein